MRRYGWTLRSALWFVFLVALGLKAATGTWHNLRRGSIEYHRRLADECKSVSASERRIASQIRDTLSSGSISHPAFSAQLRMTARRKDSLAKSYSLLEASLSKRAEMCEKSGLGWIFWQYETSRNPPRMPVYTATHVEPRPSIVNAKLNELFHHPVMMALGRVDFFWLGCLVLAIVARMKFSRVRGSSTEPG